MEIGESVTWWDPSFLKVSEFVEFKNELVQQVLGEFFLIIRNENVLTQVECIWSVSGNDFPSNDLI